jgi:hypothetical protein
MAQHALWEVVTEHLMMPNDIMALLHIPGFSDDPIEKLHYEFQFFTKDWFEVGLELKVVSLTRSTAEFISHHTTLNSMKELQHQINLSIHDIKTKAFQLGSYRDPQTTQLESIYLSCNTHGLVPSIAEDETSKIRLHDCYILLGRNFKHWNACLDFETSEASELAPREMRPLQRFQPLVVSSTCEPGDTSRSASSTPTQTSNFSPTTTSSVTEDSNSSYMTQSMFRHRSTFIPRQRLLFAYVYKNMVNLYHYNCSRDIVEKLNKQIDNIGHWFNARSALSMSIVAQKLGLFNHQPFYRKQKKSRGKNANPFMGNEENLDCLVKHFSPPKPTSSCTSKSAANISSVYCNMRPTRALHQSPFSIERDVTSRQGRQLLELLSLDRNVLLTKAKKLHLNTAAQSPRPNDQNPKTANSSDTNLELDMPKLLELAHLVHYVYTPILFLPKWRYEAHSTRLRIRSEVIDYDANLLLPSH